MLAFQEELYSTELDTGAHLTGRRGTVRLYPDTMFRRLETCLFQQPACTATRCPSVNTWYLWLQLPSLQDGFPCHLYQMCQPFLGTKKGW
jgi:hypothetical protein